MEKKKVFTMRDYAWGIRENIRYMQDELPGLGLPEEVAEPIRFALARAMGRSEVLRELVCRVSYVMGLDAQLPDGLFQRPLVLRRDIDQLLNNLREQAREMKKMVDAFQRQYEERPDYHALAKASVLMHESVGNILYIRMRLRFLVFSELSRLMDVMEAA